MNKMTNGDFNRSKTATMETIDGDAPNHMEPKEIKKEENFCKTEEKPDKMIKDGNDSKFYILFHNLSFFRKIRKICKAC